MHIILLYVSHFKIHYFIILILISKERMFWELPVNLIRFGDLVLKYCVGNIGLNVKYLLNWTHKQILAVPLSHHLNRKYSTTNGCVYEHADTYFNRTAIM